MRHANLGDIEGPFLQGPEPGVEAPDPPGVPGVHRLAGVDDLVQDAVHLLAGVPSLLGVLGGINTSQASN